MHLRIRRGARAATRPTAVPRAAPRSPLLDDVIGGGLLTALLYAIALVIVDGSRLLVA